MPEIGGGATESSAPVAAYPSETPAAGPPRTKFEVSI